MNDIQILRTYVSNIEKTLDLLSSPDFAQTNDLGALAKDFNTVKTGFSQLSKITNQGRATADLRTEKLKALKKWLEAYSANREQTLEEAIPKKLKNKDALIDTSTLDQYQRYAHLALNYMGNLTPRYQNVKSTVTKVMQTGALLNKHFDKFELSEEDLPAVDLLSDEDGSSTMEMEELDSDLLEEELDLSKAPTVAPLKMIKNIGSILKYYARFIKKVEAKYSEFMPLLQRLEQIDLNELFPKINEKNKLIQNLFKDLVNINKTLYQSDFKYKLAFREEYFKLVAECLEYLPENMAKQVAFAINRFKEKTKMEEAIDKSVGGMKQFDPTKDPNFNQSSPHLNVPKPELVEPWKADPKKIEEVKKSLQQLPGPDLTTPLKKSPFIGDELSDEEKKKYKSLWETAAKFDQNSLTKIANKLANKYKI